MFRARELSLRSPSAVELIDDTVIAEVPDGKDTDCQKGWTEPLRAPRSTQE
jgi:hypothetical protein